MKCSLGISNFLEEISSLSQVANESWGFPGGSDGKESTEELYRKDLNDPDNHDGMITHLEPDILECEIKWASLQTKLVEVMDSS